MANTKQVIFKVISILLSYPRKELIDGIPDIKLIVSNDILLTKKDKKSLFIFLNDFNSADLLDLQEEYVATFDRGRAHCLHLFEHIHGESRDRGTALVNLAELYEKKDLVINTAEMPDFLPLFLEYLSLCEKNEALELLSEPINVIATIGAKLNKRKSRWATLFKIMENLSKVKPDTLLINEALENDDEDINNLEALDKEWEETEAFADNSQDECNTCDVMPNTRQALENAMKEIS